MDTLAELVAPEALVDVAGAGPHLSVRPDLVIAPGSADEVATVLAWAARERVGILPVASGRRVGTSAPQRPYVALSTHRLTGIEEYEAADLTITARAGTSMESIDAALGDSRQWAPFDPAHVSRRSVGGLTAMGDGGPLRTGYGDLRNHVLGAKVVTGDGRILELGGRVVKNVAGFDVLKAVVGSRGTLAVITSVCLRAFPVPAVDRVLIARGSAPHELLSLARAVATAPVMPASSVIVDRLGATDGDAALVVRLHGARATVDAEQRRLERHARHHFDAPGDGGAEAGAPGAVIESVLRDVRDHATAGELRLEASGRPSRLREILEALGPLGVEEIAIDAYGGRVRACGSLPGVAALEEARHAVERSGGAIRYAAAGGPDAGSSAQVPSAAGAARASDAADAPGASDAAGGSAASAGTRFSEQEATVIRRLVLAFDPETVLWPARGRSSGDSAEAAR